MSSAAIITGGVSLVAFALAIALNWFRLNAAARRAAIEKASGQRAVELVADAVRTYRFEEDKLQLDPEAQKEIILKEIEARTERYQARANRLFGVFVVTAVVAIVAIVLPTTNGITHDDPDPTPDVLPNGGMDAGQNPVPRDADTNPLHEPPEPCAREGRARPCSAARGSDGWQVCRNGLWSSVCDPEHPAVTAYHALERTWNEEAMKPSTSRDKSRWIAGWANPILCWYTRSDLTYAWTDETKGPASRLASVGGSTWKIDRLSIEEEGHDRVVLSECSTLRPNTKHAKRIQRCIMLVLRPQLTSRWLVAGEATPKTNRCNKQGRMRCEAEWFATCPL